MLFDLKQASEGCTLSGQALAVGTLAYVTYRLGKYFLFDQKPESYWDFNDMFNGVTQKGLLGLSASATCLTAGIFLQNVQELKLK